MWSSNAEIMGSLARLERKKEIEDLRKVEPLGSVVFEPDDDVSGIARLGIDGENVSVEVELPSDVALACFLCHEFNIANWTWIFK